MNPVWFELVVVAIDRATVSPVFRDLDVFPDVCSAVCHDPDGAIMAPSGREAVG